MTLGQPYIWKDYGHVYDMSSGKIVPQTWVGWSDLSKIVSKKFMDTHVEMDVKNMTKIVVTDSDVSDFVRQNEMLWNADGPTASVMCVASDSGSTDSQF